MKTTVFGKNFRDVKNLLKSVFLIVDEPFEPRNLSTTYARNIINTTKKSFSLED
jgi:hypothetical protein